MDIGRQCHGGVHFGQCHGGVFSMVGSWVFSMVGSSSRHGYTTKGRVEGWIEPPVCPTYSRGPFIRSVQNIANMYCTECIIGIVQNAGTPSRLRFACTQRDTVRRRV